MHRAVLLHPQDRQNGVALVVALVLVLVSTLLGVSAMQSSTVETQLANNTKFQQAAFRAAEAASDSLLTLDNIVLLVNRTQTSIASTTSIETKANVSATFEPSGASAATGYSLGGQNGFRSLNFISTAAASIDAVDSSSRVSQGIQRLASSRED